MPTVVPRLTLLSCAPNCQVTFPRSDALLEIVATGPVGADEEITIDYLGVHNTTDRDKRMTHLKYAAHYATAMLTVQANVWLDLSLRSVCCTSRMTSGRDRCCGHALLDPVTLLHIGNESASHQLVACGAV